MRPDSISIHPSRVGWDAEDCLDDAAAELFQSTHPVWDGTSVDFFRCRLCVISIHPSRVGWDSGNDHNDPTCRDFNPPIPCGMGLVVDHVVLLSLYFNPPIPCGMGPSRIATLEFVDKFQSTHPVWDGTVVAARQPLYLDISIHPSRVGWDDALRGKLWVGSISIHPSRVGWDPALRGLGSRPQISIHPSRVGWDSYPSSLFPFLQISIHPSRVGWDSKKYMITYISCDSYPFCQIFRLHKMTAYSYS